MCVALKQQRARLERSCNVNTLTNGDCVAPQLACLVLQACLVCHQWYLYVFVVVTLVLFGYKGAWVSPAALSRVL